MPILAKYNHFIGRHWETGSVANVLAYQTPSEERPLSEAMLLGTSGGAAFGYFVFDYKDSDPHVSLLSRNTFDPLDTLLERLAIPQDLLRTQEAGKAEGNLIEVLENGQPAIVWADIFGLPYNALPVDDQMWAMLPVVVYGFEDGLVHIADRTAVPLTVTKDDFAQARARVKKDRFRLLALGQPDLSKLPNAIQKGIWQCISLFTEAPPKGGRDNFGFAAYKKFGAMLTNTRNKQSWERLLPPGRRMYAALAGYGYQPGAFGWARTFPSNQVDDRNLYAKFLEEAAEILNKPDLRGVANQFRRSSKAWLAFSEALLPDDVPLLQETRELLIKKRDRFVADGESALGEIRQITRRLEELRATAAADFPMSQDEVVEFREGLAEHVQRISEVEESAIEDLQSVMTAIE